jgi:opacity protein-like surface antigen
MLRKSLGVALYTSILFAAPSTLRAQLVTGGIGPVYPTGNFHDITNPGTGWMLSGRVNLSLLPLVQLQLELSTVQGWESASVEGNESLRLTSGGANLALHFVRVATLRPYVLAGVFGSNQKFSSPTLPDDNSFRFGYQTGVGLDMKLGPITPFAEVRWVSLDAPGDIRFTYVPVLLGIKLL